MASTGVSSAAARRPKVGIGARNVSGRPLSTAAGFSTAAGSYERAGRAGGERPARPSRAEGTDVVGTSAIAFTNEAQAVRVFARRGCSRYAREVASSGDASQRGRRAGDYGGPVQGQGLPRILGKAICPPIGILATSPVRAVCSRLVRQDGGAP